MGTHRLYEWKQCVCVWGGGGGSVKCRQEHVEVLLSPGNAELCAKFPRQQMNSKRSPTTKHGSPVGTFPQVMSQEVSWHN